MSQPQVPCEDPNLLLDFDAATVPPYQLLNRLTQITNALVEQYQKWSENKDKLIKFGKDHAEYPVVNSERYTIEKRISALERKYTTIEHIMYMKTAEVRMASR